MGRILLGLVVVVALLAGSPYAALALNTIMGTSTVTMTEHDGTQKTLTMGRNAPRPDWLPDMPGSILVTASRWAPNAGALESGGSEWLVHADAAAVKVFYTHELQQRGFNVEDDGLGMLNPATAAYLGMAGTLMAERPETGHELTIQIRTPDGLILKPRLLQIQWRQLGPGQASANAAYRAQRAAGRGSNAGQ